MKLAPIIEELRENCPTLERRVFGLYGWFNLDDRAAPALPCAYVLPARVTAAEATTSTKYRQKIESTFTVVLCVEMTREDCLGKSGHDTLEDLKEEVFRAILGLPLGYPENTNTIITFGGQAVNSAACSAARLAENLDFSYTEIITGDIAAQGRLIESLPALNSVRLTVPNFTPTAAELLKPSNK
nr:MAG TPA: tail completion protein [Caudoviricetes sp.]